MSVYAFGGFRLDADRMEVVGPDGPVDTEPQVFDVLRYLVEQNGRLVTKEELLDNVWGDRFVSESALTTRIKQARRLIGDDGRSQSLIRTIRGRGFRFMADVEPVGDGDGDRALPLLPRELEIERIKPFVGRDRELERANLVLTRDDPASGAWIVLLGEPGIGKTRLAGKLAQLAADRGLSVLFGRCSEDLGVPYQPFIEAIRSATAHIGDDDLRQAIGGAGHELVRLVPELGLRVPDLGRPDPADPETERHRLFEAVCGWLEAQAVNGPLALVIDDVHWATRSTLQLLVHIARRTLPVPVTFILTARDTAPDATPGVLDLITAIESQVQNVTIPLAGLDVDATRVLIDDCADAAAVVAQTAGNPLLIQALIGDDEGSIDIDTAVRRRTARLAPSVSDALSVAAIVGLEFDLKVVAISLDRDDLDLIEDLDTAVDARLLDDVGHDTYRFTHALVRATLRDEMSSPRRSRWHGRIATALEQVHAGRLDDVAPTIAHHYAEASAANPALRTVAIDHLRNAARRAVEQLSFTEASELLDRARTLTDPTDLGLLALLSIERGQAQASAGLTVAALESFDAAFDQARRAHRPDLVAEAALCYEDVSWRPGRFGGHSAERLTRALPAVGTDDMVTRARLLTALTRAYSMAGDTERSDRIFAQANEVIAELGDPKLEVRALGARYSNYMDAEPPPPLEPILRMRELCDHVDDIEADLLARQIHIRYMIQFGRMDDYRQGLRDINTIVDGLHSSFWDYIRANHNAMLALYEGDLVAAEHASAHCEVIAQRLVDDDTSGTLGLRMFVIRREQDRIQHLAPLIRRLIASGDGHTFWTPGLALLLSDIGYPDEARQILAEFRDLDFELPADALWGTVMTMLIELAVSLSDVESCRILSERFAHRRGLATVTGHGLLCLGAADRHLGMLAATMGDVERAEDHFVHAIDFDDTNGGVLWAQHARLGLADVWRRTGRTADADDLQATVRAVAEHKGYAALLRLASA